MATYSVRVELRGADSGRYNVLHDAMRKAAFTRTFVKDGEEWFLPPGEYRSIFVGDSTALQLATQIERLAQKITPEVSVMVTVGDDFEALGTFERATPVYHRPPEPHGPTGYTKCGITAPAENIRRAEADVEDQIATRKGRRCTFCFASPPMTAV
jgi:hypothetical protein